MSRNIRELATGEVGSPQPGEKVGKPKEWEKKVSKSDIEKLKKEAKQAYTNGGLDMPQYMAVLDLIGKKDFDNVTKILNLVETGQSPNLAQTVKARGKADVGRLIEMIGSQMYQGNLADVTIKEVVQNSFDAVKASLSRGLEKDGKIDIITDPGNRIIAIRDNGQGMTTKIIKDAFLTVAGTSKEGLESGQASGGLGMAKAAFLYGNEWIEVNTASRGYRSRFHAKSSELLSKDINIERTKVGKEQHGTTIIIKVPESVMVEGEKKTIWFPHDVKAISFFKKPLINDKLEIRTSQQYLDDTDIAELANVDSKQWDDRFQDFSPIPVGKNLDLSDFTKHTTAKFGWGKADIYIGKKRVASSWDIKHSILSAGIYQFNNKFDLELFEPVPYDITVNIFPDVKAESPSYPFNLKREGWKPTIKKDIELLEKYIRNVAMGIQAQETVDQFKNIKSLPKIDIDDVGTQNVDISEFIKSKPQKTEKVSKPFIPPTVTVSGTKVSGKDKSGKTVDYVDTEKEKETEKTTTGKFETDTKIKEAKDFLLDMGVDDKEPIYHNNTNVDYLELAKKNGMSAETLFSELGSLMLKAKDIIAEKMYGKYRILKSEDQSFFFGTSIDKEYHGVNLVVPFNGILLNPLAVKSKTLPGLALGYYDTIIHEFSHIPERNHEKGFIQAMSDLHVRMAEDGSDIEIRVALARILKKHQNLINLLRDEYENSTTKNIAKPLHESDKDAGIASARDEDAAIRNAEADLDNALAVEQRGRALRERQPVQGDVGDSGKGKDRKTSETINWDVKQGFASSGEYATNIKHVMDMPEIVKLAKDLLGGKYPGVVKNIRAAGGTATGIFYPGGSGRINLLASMFENPDQAAATLSHEIGHLVDYLPDRLMTRGNILGRMASLKRYMKHSLPGMPGGPGELTQKDRHRLRYQAKKFVNKEGAERWIDEVIKKELLITPDDVLNIWNAVDNAKMMNPDLLDYIQRLNTAEKKAVIKDAMKGLVRKELKQFAKVIEEKTGKKVKIKLSEEELKKLISKKYADLINEELKKRKLFDLDTITEELRSLTRAWKPFDPEANPKYTKYRYSSVELYADAFSALLNAPGLLKSHAPNFYEGFFNYIERKPEVKKLYNQIQDDIGSGNIDKQLVNRIFQRYRRGDDAYGLAYKKKGGLYDGLMREFIDAHHMILKKIRKIGEGGIPATENPRYKIEEMQYTGSEAEWYIKGDWQILKRLEDSGLTWNDFGIRLELDRVKGERSDYANPDGLTASRSKKILDEFQATRTPEQKEAMDYALEKFGKLRKYVIDKAEEAGVWADDLIEMMRNTPEYATFDVIDYIEKRHGAGPSSKIYSQIGTLKEIANPATATMLKDLSIIKAVNRQQAAKSTVQFLKKYYPDEITPADKKWNGKFQAIQNPRDKDLGLIVYLDSGKAKGYYVDKWIASSFERNPIEGQFLAKVLSTTIQPFRMAFVELNYGFWMFNLFRDYFRAMTNLPKAKARKFLPEYLRGIKHGMKSSFGIPDKVVAEMLKNNMLISIADVRGLRPEDKQIERLLKMYHMKPAQWDNKIVKPFGKMFTYFTNVGRGFERGTKVASYLYLKKHFPDLSDEEIGHMVRVHGGSPDFLGQGTFSPVYNNILMFSNAIKQGYRGDYEAFSKNPGEFMWKKTKYAYLPKLLMYSAQIGLLGVGIKAIMEGVSEYDKTNYSIIPLGLTETGKSVYLRIPIDETGRLMGGIFWKLLSRDTKKMTTGLIDYMAGQAPTTHPGIDVLIASVQYASGLNPYDNFRGRYAIPDQVFKAGGERSHEAFVKWIANKSGATLVHRFKTDDVDRIKTNLERIVGFPFASNIVGRFVKVSNTGLREELKELKSDIQSARQSELLDAKDAILKWVNGEQLSEKEITMITENPDIIERNLLVSLSRRYGAIFLEEVLTAATTKEKGAIVKRWIERQRLLKEAKK
ncbi:MAG TPA: ATP-binding protein [Desulfobacterales bacterium]|nr:ATP-binding protein [Desulfobacterales bacterium]